MDISPTKSRFLWVHTLKQTNLAGFTPLKQVSSSRRIPTPCAPDVAFVSQERLQEVTSSTGYFPGPPDLAIEIISPNDRHNEVEEVEMWLRYGVQMVVTLNPQLRTAMVHRSPDDIRMLRDRRAARGGNVVPGWTLPLIDLFHSIDKAPSKQSNFPEGLIIV